MTEQPITSKCDSSEQGDQENWTQGLRGYDPRKALGSFSVRYARWCIMGLLVALLGVSLAFVYSATIASQGSKIVMAQARWMVIGGFAMSVFCWIPLRRLYQYSFWMLVIVALALAYLAVAQSMGGLPFAPPVKGAVRWIRIAGFQLQPSECAKFVLALYLGAYYNSVRYGEVRGFLKGVFLPLLPVGGTLALMLLGRDLSSTMLTSGMVFAMMFLGGIRFRHLMLICMVGVAFVILMICVSTERISRVKSWMNPEDNVKDGGYQVRLSKTAMAGGGAFGKGYMKGVIKGWIPENHTDFIVAVIGEEAGLCGVYFVLSCYLGLCVCITAIARASRHVSDSVLGLGIAVLLAAQVLINIGVVSDLGPTTGVTAPFLSYGGTSMVVMLCFMGLVLNIARHNSADVKEHIARLRMVG